MTHKTESFILDAVDCSVVQTIEAFVRFRPGFHGDTGIRDYLYHRLMTNLPDGGIYRRPGGVGTLLAQAEWYTKLNYRGTGKESSPGRFDIGIPKPDELDLAKPDPLVAFECGRNKKATKLLRDIDASVEHEGPEPGDITKLAREIIHGDLAYGYALEFFDRGLCGEAEDLVGRLRGRVPTAKSDRLHVVVLICVGGRGPMLTFLPAVWEERVRLGFRSEMDRIGGLTCASIDAGVSRRPGTVGGYGNRVTREEFLSSCSPEARALIEAIEKRFGHRIKLIFGGNTMTVNRWPSGTLLRINKATNAMSDLDSEVSHELVALLQLSIRNSRCEIDGTEAFREAVVTAVGQGLDGSSHDG